LEATLGEPRYIGDVSQGRRRIVPQTGGTFTGPELNGRLLAAVRADWQTVLPDGAAIGDIRYALQTDDGALLYVQSRSVRHGPPEVLARLARGEEVDASDYTFRAATEIDCLARLGLAEQGCLHQRRRSYADKRDLRHLPGRVTPPASEPEKVAIITGASQGIGAGLVEGYRRAGYAVVGTLRSSSSSVSLTSSPFRATPAAIR
jgi:hypothetical protein